MSREEDEKARLEHMGVEPTIPATEVKSGLPDFGSELRPSDDRTSGGVTTWVIVAVVVGVAGAFFWFSGGRAAKPAVPATATPAVAPAKPTSPAKTPPAAKPASVTKPASAATTPASAATKPASAATAPASAATKPSAAATTQPTPTAAPPSTPAAATAPADSESIAGAQPLRKHPHHHHKKPPKKPKEVKLPRLPSPPPADP
jgi:cytoskeletal protein RodZ